ncbi:hypothetical protein DFP72DRAFT_620029 [Ephemerocybe angulata]|uniref:F-box domain-containing protein n=1 Tax=Ephemerocybe angulata TaxID=980116 RepID=A0A8H6LZF5_9AGAR|nr:hypothetical protein DFP72DRAFT_620029 [Tulosesus angulatus]
MVTTRRKSAVAPVHVVVAEPESDSDSSEQFSDDGDFVQGTLSARKKASVAMPKAKRQKVADTPTTSTSISANAKAKAKPPPKRRRGKDLSLLPTMPLDILFEILGQLSPRDLLILTRTNTLFRKTLLEKNAQCVWVSARGFHGVPEPPSDFSERRWAGLLYSNHCQVKGCGTPGVRKVDWFLRKRICTQCKKDRYMVHSKFKTKYPDLDNEILNYIPSTHVGPWANGYSSNSKYYWEADIPAAAEEWETLEHAAAMGSAAAKRIFTEWKDDRARWIENILEDARVYHQWDGGRISLAELNRERRLEGATSRLLQLGYQRGDIEGAISVQTDGIITGNPDVTDTIWAKLKLKLEPLVVKEKIRRLSREMADVVNSRKTLLKNMYDGFLSTLRPLERYQCPPAPFLRILPEVSALINAEDAVVTAQDFQPIITNMAEHLTKYQGDFHASVIATIPASERDGVANPLDLAKFAFSCQAASQWGHNTCSKFLAGWETIASHPCVNQWRFNETILEANIAHQVTYNPTTSAIASSLIRIVGLDPKTARIADMEQRNGRFVCGSCRVSNNITVHNWGSAVKHGCPVYRGQTPCPAVFRLATPEETAKAQAATLAIFERDGRVWSCNLCGAHTELHNCLKKPDILEHLKTQHAITEPQILQDYFLNRKCDDICDKPLVLNIPKVPKVPKVANPKVNKGASNKAHDCRCLQCPHGGGNRRFIMEGVIMHLKAKHGVASPQPNIDYAFDPTLPARRPGT